MGGKSSKQGFTKNRYGGKGTGQDMQYSQRMKGQKESSKAGITPSRDQQTTVENKSQILVESSPKLNVNYSDDDFYDGIPRYSRTHDQKSRPSKVSEVGSFLGRAGSFGLGRAVEVLDTLGSSMTNLNSNTGFISGATAKHSAELSILAFEVANTIVKGSHLMQSLSNRSIHKLKEVVLSEESVKRLISNDMNELLEVVAGDKREELKVFSEEVVRFGNRCKDPQWHNLNLFFEKHSRESNPHMLSRNEAESMMQQLMTLVQLTAELYQEMNLLERFKQDYQQRRLEELKLNKSKKGEKDNTLSIVAAEFKSQKKVVKNLNKKSLWSRSMEEIMGQLVDVVLFLNQEINNVFGIRDGETMEKVSRMRGQTLGNAGLGLHYANIIIQIDSIVSRSSTVTSNSRDNLYQSLPPIIKASLRSKLQSFKVEKELAVTEIKDEMEKTLHWLVPTATNTAKAHHGFGWVGEWVNAGADHNRKTVSPTCVMKIETLQHANREKVEANILDLLLWLNYLVSQSKSSAKDSIVKTSIMSSVGSPRKEYDKQISAREETTVTPQSLSRDDNKLQSDCDCKSEKFDGTRSDNDLDPEAISKKSSEVSTNHEVGNEMSLDMNGKIKTDL